MSVDYFVPLLVIKMLFEVYFIWIKISKDNIMYGIFAAVIIMVLDYVFSLFY